VGPSQLALWFLCGLGTAIFAAVQPMRRRTAVVCAIAFAAGAWWADLGVPFEATPAILGCMTAAIAALYLTGPWRPVYAVGLAGLLAGVWVGPLEAEGLPLIPAAMVAAVVPLVSARLRLRHAAFAPPALRDEALLFALALGLVVAAAPTIVDGWHAATNLKMQGQASQGAAAIPAWTLSLSAAALVVGGLYSLWSRR
jgi:hypothetical protein